MSLVRKPPIDRLLDVWSVRLDPGVEIEIGRFEVERGFRYCAMIPQQRLRRGESIKLEVRAPRTRDFREFVTVWEASAEFLECEFFVARSDHPQGAPLVLLNGREGKTIGNPSSSWLRALQTAQQRGALQEFISAGFCNRQSLRVGFQAIDRALREGTPSGVASSLESLRRSLERSLLVAHGAAQLALYEAWARMGAEPRSALEHDLAALAGGRSSAGGALLGQVGGAPIVHVNAALNQATLVALHVDVVGVSYRPGAGQEVYVDPAYALELWFDAKCLQSLRLAWLAALDAVQRLLRQNHASMDPDRRERILQGHVVGRFWIDISRDRSRNDIQFKGNSFGFAAGQAFKAALLRTPSDPEFSFFGALIEQGEKYILKGVGQVAHKAREVASNEQMTGLAVVTPEDFEDAKRGVSEAASPRARRFMIQRWGVHEGSAEFLHAQVVERHVVELKGGKSATDTAPAVSESQSQRPLSATTPPAAPDRALPMLLASVALVLVAVFLLVTAWEPKPPSPSSRLEQGGQQRPEPKPTVPVPLLQPQPPARAAVLDVAPACTPACSERSCGPDGCGGVCRCGPQESCTGGRCVAEEVSLAGTYRYVRTTLQGTDVPFVARLTVTRRDANHYDTFAEGATTGIGIPVFYQGWRSRAGDQWHTKIERTNDTNFLGAESISTIELKGSTLILDSHDGNRFVLVRE